MTAINSELLKFRHFFTSNKVLVLAGKSAEQNELLIKRFTMPNEIVMHTEAPGSPFCVLKGKPKKQDMEEAAIFCACFSKQWKKNAKKAIVHAFFGNAIYKTRQMPKGTFGVKKILEKIEVKLELYANIIDKKILVLPYEKNAIGILGPGKLPRQKVIEKLRLYAKNKGLELDNAIEMQIPPSNIDIKL